ncbi:MAG: nitroreductase family protein [Proteobacteria bacterium]|nr:nitroreductase family protein [Pseudomonadota bacterium]MDA1357482.1 nitroreductase family protein [Pseudomonadota bacterium]
MKNSANNDFPILDQLRDRWSPRAFSNRPVPPESVRSLLEAARWAPSCFNAQPWRFIIATRQTDSEFQAALSCLVEGNQKWAEHAPVLLFAVARMNFENGKENRHALYDTGQAMAHLSVQATALGLFVHQMGGILPDQIQQTYGLPEGYEAASGAAIGYYGETDSLAENLREMELAPRARMALSETVYSGAWGQPASL